MLGRSEPKLYRIIGDYKQIAIYEGYSKKLDFYLYESVRVSLKNIKQLDSEWQHSSFDLYARSDAVPLRALRWGTWYENVPLKRAEDTEPVGEAPIFEVCVMDANKLSCTTRQDIYSCHSMANVAVYRITFGGKEYSYYPDSYLAMMKEASKSVIAGKKNPIIEGIKSIFHNYSHPMFTLFLSRRRHHLALADQVRTDLPDDLESARQYLLKQRQALVASDKDGTLNYQGDFMRRIDFAIAHITGHLVNKAALLHEQAAVMRRSNC